ncbi:MAG TPA: ATP-binding cassette domain-containing protein [Kofleriaceae bacterium]|nr:ATP-binding cassette domain-containing protein [Kofleriaceae bacterium]
MSFAYGGGDPVLDDISITFDTGWTGVVGANGAGKTTLVRLAVGSLDPTGGVIAREPRDAVCVVVAQTPEAPIDRSPGEHKRAALEDAFARDPDVLVLDEPTNHIDADTRAWLIGRLARFRGAGVLVSHDRALLDALARSIVRVDGGRAVAYSGGYSAAKAQWDAEASARRGAYRAASDEKRAIERRLASARQDTAAASRNQRVSARMKGPRDSDARGILATTKAMWAADGAGRRAQVLRRELDDATVRAGALAMTKEKGGAVAVGWEPPPKRRLITHGARAIDRDSRIHVAGPNGVGKTTLLAAMVRACALPAERVFHLPQERTNDDGAALAAAIRALDRETRGRTGQIAAALGLDPSVALRSEQPSPGEARKLEIALALARRVWLCILDEPTNHLDLPSVERLEAALADYPGALVLVTHDDAFAARLTNERWGLS